MLQIPRIGRKRAFAYSFHRMVCPPATEKVWLHDIRRVVYAGLLAGRVKDCTMEKELHLNFAPSTEIVSKDTVAVPHLDAATDDGWQIVSQQADVEDFFEFRRIGGLSESGSAR